MPKYVIERSIPGVGSATPQDLQAISQKSCSVLEEMGPKVQWVESFVTQDKVYCVYNADSEESVREHARRGGFPADSVARVMNRIDPTTAEATRLAYMIPARAALPPVRAKAMTLSRRTGTPLRCAASILPPIA